MTTSALSFWRSNHVFFSRKKRHFPSFIKFFIKILFYKENMKLSRLATIPNPDLCPVFEWHLKTGPVFKCHSNTGPFHNRTLFYHLNTEHVRYSDPHCTIIFPKLPFFTPFLSPVWVTPFPQKAPHSDPHCTFHCYT